MHRVLLYFSGKSADFLRLRQLLCRFSIFSVPKTLVRSASLTDLQAPSLPPVGRTSALSYLESTHAKGSKFGLLTPFRINTCKSASKQTTLTSFRTNL